MAANQNDDRRPRVDLTEEERKDLPDLLGKVPQVTKIQRNWKTDEGRTFAARARSARDRGVPVRWMAQFLGVDERSLLQVIENGQRPTRRR